MSRRGFLVGCGACAAAGLSAWPMAARGEQGTGKVRIRIVYVLTAVKQPGPDWPNVGFDFAPVMERINGELTKRCPNFEFVTSMAAGPEQAQTILDDDVSAGIDGYIVYQMNAWNQVVQTIAKSGKPVLYADFQYGGSGGFLVYMAAFLRSKTPNVGFVASSRIEDLVEAVKRFELIKLGNPPAEFVRATTQARTMNTPTLGDPQCTPDHVPVLSPRECIARMKESRILAVRGTESGPAGAIMDIPLEHVPFAEVNEAWKAADKEEAGAIADRWRRRATEIVDVSRETLESSAAMYLGMKAVLDKHKANAITMNCLGGFYGGHIHAYPCLGFHELCNEGLIGGCECDVRSAAAMVMLNALTHGRPGFISDPVIDTSKRQIIYAHCVASNKVFGPKGPMNPFTILTHSEDRQGASVRSILPLNHMTTTVQVMQDSRQILFHQGKAVENDPDDRACRTKLAVKPIGDMEKLFTMWDQWGWHRVTCYGDLRKPIFALADALGWKVVEEA